MKHYSNALRVLHPVLFGAYAVLFLFSQNIEQVELIELWIPMGIAILFAIVVLGLVRLVLPDADKAVVVTSLFLLIVYSYGHVWNLAGDFLMIWRHKYLMILSGAIFVLGTYMVWKTRSALRGLNRALTWVSLVLVVITMSRVVWYELTRPTDAVAAVSRKQMVIPGKALNSENVTYPDIYYIIFDRYASSDTLKDIFGYDNREFTDYLTRKGFYVAFASRANYAKTFQSLASSLNMVHLRDLTQKIVESNSDRRVIYRMLQDYKVWRFLKSKGYSFIHLGSWWNPTRKNKYADINYNISGLNLSEFSALVLKSTLLYPFLGRKMLGIMGHVDKQQIRRIPYKFEKLGEIPRMKGPKFVFAHMLAPHPPQVFGRDGQVLSLEDRRKRGAKEKYLDELIFINKKIKALVKEILENSDRPPVIVLQSDEGPCTLLKGFRGRCGGKIDWTELSVRSLKGYMSILNAYYLPNVNKEEVLYESITPVNTFRVIFNLYFGTHHELLRDESYIYPDLGHPYKYINVTRKVRGEKKREASLGAPKRSF